MEHLEPCLARVENCKLETEYDSMLALVARYFALMLLHTAVIRF